MTPDVGRRGRRVLLDAGRLGPAYRRRSGDCLQLGVTRCGGVTGFLQAADLAAASNLQVSGHCAPNLRARVAGSVPNLRHVEYFHDHQRIKQRLFDGALSPQSGVMTPDDDRCGLGLELRAADAEPYRRA